MSKNNEMIRQYMRARSVLQFGGVPELTVLETELDGFPHGVDPYVGRRWIIHAIDVGSMDSIHWMISRGVELGFRDKEGYTPLLSALERQQEDRLDLLDLLLESGAPVNLKGLNDWTPAHMAAANDDVNALRILVAQGADLSIRTEIDDCATPLEEARNLGKLNAVRYLESVV